MVAVEVAHAVAAHAARQHGHVIDIGVVRHGRHGGVKVAGQFRLQMLLVGVQHRLLGGR